MGNSYLSSVARIMDRGLTANSYKFALLRALVAEVKLPGIEPLVIDNSQLAHRFIGLYWPLTLRFKIRQATVPGKDPVVMRYIRKAISDAGSTEEISVEDYRRKHRNDYETLVKRVARGAFRDVIPRFHMISGHSVEPRIYEIDAEGITILPEVQRFIFDNAQALELLAILHPV